MNRAILALAIASVLSSCSSGGGGSLQSDGSDGIGTGQQPLTEEPDVTGEPDSDGGSQDAGGAEDPNVYANQTDDGPALRMNNISYDRETDELVLNNLDFDDANPYSQAEVASASFAADGSGFRAYQNDIGPDEYYAVFRLSDEGYGQAAAVGSRSEVFDRTLDIGGAGAERLVGSGRLPAANATYLFNGEYAGVRTIRPDLRGGQTEEIQYVTGTTQLTVDIQDFDTTGSVRGLVFDRTVFDAMGVPVGDRAMGEANVGDTTFVRLDRTDIDFDNWTIVSGDAQLVHVSATSEFPTPREDNGTKDGRWEGLFVGPNGEEVVGIVVVEDSTPISIGIDPTTGQYNDIEIVREVGGFVGSR